MSENRAFTINSADAWASTKGQLVADYRLTVCAVNCARADSAQVSQIFVERAPHVSRFDSRRLMRTMSRTTPRTTLGVHNALRPTQSHRCIRASVRGITVSEREVHSANRAPLRRATEIGSLLRVRRAPCARDAPRRQARSRRCRERSSRRARVRARHARTSPRSSMPSSSAPLRIAACSRRRWSSTPRSPLRLTAAGCSAERPPWTRPVRVRVHWRMRASATSSTRSLAAPRSMVFRAPSGVLPRRLAGHRLPRRRTNRCAAVAAGRRSPPSPRRPRARTLRSGASALFRHRRGPGRGAMRRTPCSAARSHSSADRSDGIVRSASGAPEKFIAPRAPTASASAWRWAFGSTGAWMLPAESAAVVVPRARRR